MEGSRDRVPEEHREYQQRADDSHPDDSLLGTRLARHEEGLPYISELLQHLNRAQKYVSYGDVTPPLLDPEEVASEIEEYLEAVARIIDKSVKKSCSCQPLSPLRALI